MTTLTNTLAGIIRNVDGDNSMRPRDLGYAIADKFPPFIINQHGNDIAAFVERTNPDKQIGASALAELIVAEFDLDEENR
jgi:hypothetical protein